jgi:hypothetical protein
MISSGKRRGVGIALCVATSLAFGTSQATAEPADKGTIDNDALWDARSGSDDGNRAMAAGFDDLVILDQFDGSSWITSIGGGASYPIGSATTWSAAGTRLLGGDLHGDAVGDAVVVRRVTGGFQLWALPWNGVGYDPALKSLWGLVNTGGFNFDRSRQLMGDVNGDGFDDIVTIHHQLTGGLRVWVHPNTGSGFGTPQQWQNLSTGGWSYDKSRQSLADVDGDGLADLVTTHRLATGGLVLWVHLSTGTLFEVPAQWQNLSAGGWSYDGSRQMTGDVNGDGLDDVVSAHRQSTGGLILWAHLSGGASFQAPAVWQNLRTGGWSFANSQQRVLDLDNDGIDDVLTAHRSGDGLYRLWMHFSTGSSFTPPDLLFGPDPTFLYDGAEVRGLAILTK